MAVPYIFILGTGHSGGTLLNLMLGASPKVFAAGESLHLWNLANLDRQDEETRLFWDQAVSRLESIGWPLEQLTRTGVLQADTDLWRNWIDIVSEISAQPVIADKSNHLPIVRMLCDTGLVQPFFVHLVRDPRAVAYSYARVGKLDLATQRSWQVSNAAIADFLKGRADAMVLRYEDLAANPWHHAFQILDRAGHCLGLDLTSAIPADISDRSLDDPVFDNLMYGGNVMRNPARREGRMIEPNIDYLKALSAPDWATTTLLTLPGLRQFGYPIGRRSTERMLVQS